MATDYFFFTDPLEINLEELNAAIEIVNTCCRLLDIQMLFCGIYVYILPLDADVRFGEQARYAIDCIADYCQKTYHMLWFTGTYLYHSSYLRAN